MALSDAKVRNAKVQSRPYKIADGEGLFLLVAPTGSKYWRFRYFFHGNPHNALPTRRPFAEIGCVETLHDASLGLSGPCLSS
jgi:hypothetical protein